MQAAAAEIVVDDAGDDVASGDGACTLRAALANANADQAVYADCAAGDGADRITFDLNAGAVIRVAGVPFELDAPLVIDGGVDDDEGPGITLDAHNDSRIIEVGSGVAVDLQGLRMQNGLVADHGGAILVAEGARLTIRDCELAGNKTGLAAKWTSGGAIYGYGAEVIVDRSRLDGNQATNYGGAISLYEGGAHPAVLVLRRTEIRGSFANQPGGAIHAAEGVEVLIDSSTIADNRSNTLSGGALYLGDVQAAEISNTTLSGNSAGSSGGAIRLDETSGAEVGLILSHVTVTDNSAGSGGAGLHVKGDSATITLRNSLVAGNGDADCATVGQAEIAREGMNIVGETCGAGNAPPADLVASLDDHGGATRTHLPLAAALVDTAADQYCPDEDQRGRPRPGTGCDIGSVERQPTRLRWTAATYTGTEGEGEVAARIEAVAGDWDHAVAVGLAYGDPDDTAVPVDYEPGPGTVALAPGADAPVTLGLIADGLDEATERLTVCMTNPEVTSGGGTARVADPACAAIGIRDESAPADPPGQHPEQNPGQRADNASSTGNGGSDGGGGGGAVGGLLPALLCAAWVLRRGRALRRSARPPCDEAGERAPRRPVALS